MIVSREAKKKQAIRDEQVKLFTHSTAVKFVNALNKLRTIKAIKDSARSNYIESVTRQWRKSAPPILSTSHSEFYGTHSCTNARKTILLAPIHPFTRQIVPLVCEELLT